MALTSKNWCLTINNPTDDDVACFARDPAVFTYWGYCREVGAEGTPHLQAFVCLVKKSRLNAVKRLFPRAHVEKMIGNILQNEIYCSKEGALIVFGVPPLSAAATEKKRWKEAKRLMKAGDLDALPEDIFIRYYSTAKAIAKDYMAKPLMLEGVCGTWISGEPGTGKSYAVVTTYPDRYIKPLNKWWDGYQGEEVVHLDELDPSHAPWIAAFLKKWADRYPFDAEIKGGALQLRPKKIIVTSNYTIDEMRWDPITTTAIKRRFNSIIKVINQNIII